MPKEDTENEEELFINDGRSREIKNIIDSTEHLKSNTIPDDAFEGIGKFLSREFKCLKE